MTYTQNKPLNEYGDLSSVHHRDTEMQRQAGREEARIKKLPPTLEIQQHVGGSYIIGWNKGEGEVPRECQGIWNSKIQAERAIGIALTRLARDADEAEAKEAADAVKAKAAARKAAEPDPDNPEPGLDTLEEMEARADEEAAASKPKRSRKKST